MKLLDRAGNALLTKLVPGIDAKASCGRCRAHYLSCRCCGGTYSKPVVYVDACDNYCYTRCWNALECLDRPRGC
jgi:hypothetical protein